MENWISQIKSYFVLLIENLLKNLLSLKFLFELLVHYDPFLLTIFQHLLSKELGSKQILLRWRAWLYGIPLLQWYGWHEEFGFWWLSVGYTYKSVIMFPPISETVTSKTLSDVWDYSVVNSIVECVSFKCYINSPSLSSCSQQKKMSSKYLHHRYCFSSISLKISSSNLAINNILNGGANFVPIAVSHFCFKIVSLKVKISFLRTTSASSTSAEVVKSFSCLKTSPLCRANRPSSGGMLGYKPTTSTVYLVSSVGYQFLPQLFIILSPFKWKCFPIVLTIIIL